MKSIDNQMYALFLGHLFILYFVYEMTEAMNF